MSPLRSSTECQCHFIATIIRCWLCLSVESLNDTGRGPFSGLDFAANEALEVKWKKNVECKVKNILEH